MKTAPRFGGLLAVLAGVLLAGCGNPAATPVAALDSTTPATPTAEQPAPAGDVPLPPTPPPGPAADPETPPPFAVRNRKVDGLPTTDRSVLRAKFLPVIDRNNRTPPQPFPEPPSPLDDNKPAKMDPALEKKVNRLKQWAGFLRGKKLKNEIKLAQMSDKEVAAMLLNEKNQELPPEKIFAQEEESVALGFFPDNLDVKKMAADLVSAGVGAFYEPKSKHFVMVTHENANNNDPIMKAFQEISDEITTVHELTHAVQDQYFDLQKMLPPDAPADRAAAIRALVEGDATFVMLEYGIARQTGGQRPDLLARGTGAELAEAMTASMDGNPMVPENTAKMMKLAPRLLSEELMFSYGQGFGFAYALHAAGNTQGAKGVKGQIAAMDAAFGQPPESTEQILHPEKYIDPEKYDAPTFLSEIDLTQVAAGSLPGYIKLGSDEMGEFRMKLWFEEIQRGGLYTHRIPDYKTRLRATRQQRMSAEIAAAGWDGSRVTTYQKPMPDSHARTLLTIVADFDSGKDAAEAAEIFVLRAKQMSPEDARFPPAIDGVAAEPQEPRLEFWAHGDFGSHAVLFEGSRVVYVQDAEAELARPLAKRLMADTVARGSPRTAPNLAPAAAVPPPEAPNPAAPEPAPAELPVEQPAEATP